MQHALDKRPGIRRRSGGGQNSQEGQAPDQEPVGGLEVPALDRHTQTGCQPDGEGQQDRRPGGDGRVLAKQEQEAHCAEQKPGKNAEPAVIGEKGDAQKTRGYRSL